MGEEETPSTSDFLTIVHLTQYLAAGELRERTISGMIDFGLGGFRPKRDDYV